METTQVKADLPVEQEDKAKKTGLRLPKLKGKKRKWLKRLLILAAVVLAVWWFFLRPMQSAGTQGAAGLYLPAAAQRQDLSISVSGTGTLAPAESYNVTALVSGDISEAPFEAGDWIEKGALLYRIGAKNAEISLQEAQLTLSGAQTAYDNLVRNLRPYAGISGVVQKVYVHKGDSVSLGAAIADVADTSVMFLTLPFQSADAAKLSVGQGAAVTLSGTMETLNGTVDSISSAELVGAGGALVRQVKIKVSNPGALTVSTAATAAVGTVSCAGSAVFEEASRQTVVAQASGEVTDVPVTAGSRVSSGDALAVLGGSAAEASLQNAASSLESARLALQRTQDALDNYTITAPISGTVIEKNFKSGDKVNSMDSGTLAVLYDLTSMELKLNVNELDIGKIKAGQPVEITAAALPGQVFRGEVERVSINGTTTNGFTTYPVTIRLTEYGALNPGMNVSAVIQCETVKNALCVPVDAVSRGNTVLIPALGADGAPLTDPALAEERSVVLGRNDAEYIEITSGLEEGEQVLIPGQSAPAIGG